MNVSFWVSWFLHSCRALTVVYGSIGLCALAVLVTIVYGSVGVCVLAMIVIVVCVAATLLRIGLDVSFVIGFHHRNPRADCVEDRFFRNL